MVDGAPVVWAALAVIITGTSRPSAAAPAGGGKMGRSRLPSAADGGGEHSPDCECRLAVGTAPSRLSSESSLASPPRYREVRPWQRISAFTLHRPMSHAP